MDPNFLMTMEIVGAIYTLASAIYYLTWAVATLSVVGLVGYFVALRKAKP